MKTAYQWQDELNGDTSVESIERIQVDALIEAMRIVNNNGQRSVEVLADKITAMLARKPNNGRTCGETAAGSP